MIGPGDVGISVWGEVPWVGHGSFAIKPQGFCAQSVSCDRAPSGWGMLRVRHSVQRHAVVMGAIVLGLALSACSSGIGTPGPAASAAAPPPASSQVSSNNPSFKDKIAGFFAGSTARSPQPVVGAQDSTGAPQNIECPFIDIRQGASTLTIGPTANADPNSTNNGAMAVKYQGDFVRAARDCTVVGGNIVMRVGVQGRIIVGPAGGPGQVDVPLRIAVVDETTAATKPIVTKFIRIPVQVVSPTENPTFTHVEDDITFPKPSARELEHYIVYIGFDPLALQTQERSKPRPAARPKPKLRPSVGSG